MENQTEICRGILYDFLDRWPVENVKKMTLNQYVSVGDSDTFCQWVETRTIDLGNIKGLIGSIKFGIYKRKDEIIKPDKYVNDEKYSWQKSLLAKSKDEAFKIVKDKIIQVINYANAGNISAIDNIGLSDIFKWKVAFLYSNERIIPIFSREVLKKIAVYFGIENKNPISYSAIHQQMISNKPAHLSIYEYAAELWNKFGKKKKIKLQTRRTTRRASTGKNTGAQIRRGTTSYIVTQKHNILQEALKQKLIVEYGQENVFMEENFVDIKVVLPDKICFYEVKSSAYASDCIKEALGQILSYSYVDKDKKSKQLIVAGQYKPNDDEKNFIKYVKENLKLNFDYENIDLD
jgi:hypothetical protein